MSKFYSRFDIADQAEGIDELAVEAAYYAAKDKPAVSTYRGDAYRVTSRNQRECFECGGYGYHFNYCDKVM